MATPFIGEIIGFGGNFAPRSYALCQGQLLSIAQNTALFSILGTTYGGNGQTTFALPDLRGRAPIGQGQGPGLQNYDLGQVGGTENATLLTGNLPSHTHAGTLNANQVKATAQTPQTGSMLARAADPSSAGSTPEIYVPTGTAGAQVALGGLTIGNTGNNLPFPILSPYLTINWLIALEGIFPSRN
ncbi:phage tail protein [Sphingomonas bacterium]|uniref:phage tail protein n=1 Tax=Sphingomonas bacterium TaxID=1895847 RepID=UPI00263A139B|nr:tail fiber protein [Sphingomonas bacterium]MDB5678682.1 Tail Collar domain protein [Sphingomonas bacterium]